MITAKRKMIEFFDELRLEMEREEKLTLSSKHKVKIRYETGLAIFEINGKEFYFNVSDKTPGYLFDDVEFEVERKPEENLSIN